MHKKTTYNVLQMRMDKMDKTSPECISYARNSAFVVCSFLLLLNFFFFENIFICDMKLNVNESKTFSITIIIWKKKLIERDRKRQISFFASMTSELLFSWLFSLLSLHRLHIAIVLRYVKKRETKNTLTIFIQCKEHEIECRDTTTQLFLELGNVLLPPNSHEKMPYIICTQLI